MGKDCHAYDENESISVSTGTEFQWVDFMLPYSYDSSYDNLLIIFQTPYEYAHRKEEIYISQIGKILSLEQGSYSIHIHEKHISRLPHPYTSRCLDGNIASNIFSDKYTFQSCQEECAFNHMLKECNDVIDVWKKYHTFEAKPFTNSKYLDFKNCLDEIDVIILTHSPTYDNVKRCNKCIPSKN